MTITVWGIDVYSGNAMTKTKLQALKNGGATFIYIKSSMGWGDDSNVQQTFQWAKEVGLLTGIYHWVDGTNTSTAQISRVSKWIDLLHPDMVSADFEQWWSSWDKYWLWARGLIPFNEVPWLPVDVMDKCAKELVAGINSKYPNQFLQLYTGAWFSSCDPLMVKWINNYSGWYADYSKWSGHKRTFSTWNEFNTSINTLSNLNPLLPSGATSYDLWQCGVAKLPGLGSQYHDINIYKYDLEEFRELISGTETPPPDPFGEVYQCLVSYLTVRTGPGTQYAPAPFAEWLQGSKPGHLVADRITVVEKNGVWGRFGASRWVNTSSQYMREIG